MMINSSPVPWRETEFRKSSFSGANGGECVEVAWRDGSGDAGLPRAGMNLGIRDSKNAAGSLLVLGESQAKAFIAAVKNGH